MLAKVIIENGVKKIQALTADTGAGAPVGSLISMYKKSSPSGYLYCDGSTFDETAYPTLYQYLGSNVLPDYRECVAVGAEQNTTDTIADHDVYTEGQFKDDQLQKIAFTPTTDAIDVWTDGNHEQDNSPFTITNSGYSPSSGSYGAFQKLGFDSSKCTRSGTTTHGKQKAVFVYIKATSGLSENQQENVLNTINENNSYSTEEHATGKTWIDGKPIYRKVITSNFGLATTASTTISLTSNNLNIETTISITAVLKDGSAGYIRVDGNFIVEFAPNEIKVTNKKTNWNLGTADQHFILEYTKTTD